LVGFEGFYPHNFKHKRRDDELRLPEADKSCGCPDARAFASILKEVKEFKGLTCSALGIADQMHSDSFSRRLWFCVKFFQAGMNFQIDIRKSRLDVPLMPAAAPSSPAKTVSSTVQVLSSGPYIRRSCRVSHPDQTICVDGRRKR
jgi:hypothetical protein